MDTRALDGLGEAKSWRQSMTTICWDGHTLAADKRSCNGPTIYQVTKIFRVRGCLVGGSGSFSSVIELVQWFAAGADPAKLPAFQNTKDNNVDLLVIDKDGTILKFDSGPYPIKIESARYAIGSGREIALTAMVLGKTAEEAIEIASMLDCYTGNGIDTLTLDE